MAQCMCKMMLDVADRDAVQTVVARQGDSATRFLRLRLFSYGEPMRVEEGGTALLNVRNTAGELRAFEGTVNPDGTLTLPLNAWMLRSVGIVQCDVSIVDAGGGKLTTPPFEIEVVATVAADEILPGDSEGEDSLTARLLAEEKVYTLSPVQTAEGYSISPACNRKYALDLSNEIYTEGEAWKTISLVLPLPEDLASDNWILIYCHAPLHGGVGVSIDWGEIGSLLFADGNIPDIKNGDFDIICSYSTVAGKWQIGTVQYSTVGGDV